MFHSVEKPITFFTIAGKNSSPYHGDPNVDYLHSVKEKEIEEEVKAQDKQAKEDRLVARNAKREEKQASDPLFVGYLARQLLCNFDIYY